MQHHQFPVFSLRLSGRWPLRLLALYLLLQSHLSFGQQTITLADLFERRTFAEESVYGINWMKDGRYYTSLENNSIVKYDVTTGQSVEVLVDGNALRPIVSIQDYSFSADERQILIQSGIEPIYRRSYKADYYLLEKGSDTLRPLSAAGKQSYATFSPDGQFVAFVRENNLFYVRLTDMQEIQVTTDGKQNELIHGSTDWVYEEEFSFAQAFYWSPDSKKIAYQSFDEREVPVFNMPLWKNGALYPSDYLFKYPKAGEKNAVVSLTVFHLDGEKKVKVDVGTETDMYVPRVQWTQNPEQLSFIRLNRLQNHLELFHAEAGTGASRLALSEKSETYVDIDFCDDLTYLKDGKHFIYSSEADGHKHLYLYEMSGRMVRQLTTGNWEVNKFLGINEALKTPVLYYTSKEDSPLENALWQIDLTGKKKTRLSTQRGNNSVNMSPDFSYYIHYHKNTTTPALVQLYKTDKNQLVKTLVDNAALLERIRPYRLSAKEMFSFKASHGETLNGYMLKPANFDPAKKYPVLMFQYSGPGSQQVMNDWAGGQYFWHQMLAQKGYLIAVVDGRGTGGRGRAFKHTTYGQLGRYETEDQIEAAKYLGTLPYIDAARIGIWGWSYGGYMSSLCILLGADYFKAAIAVAPVTNWRYYDTIYTERYLKRPQDNPDGYDDNSPVQHVHRLKGKYLLIHGTADDNVHFQNAVALQSALIKAGKQFESFYYPDRNHGIYGGNTRYHLFEMMTRFIEQNL